MRLTLPVFQGPLSLYIYAWCTVGGISILFKRFVCLVPFNSRLTQHALIFFSRQLGSVDGLPCEFLGEFDFEFCTWE